MSDTAQGHPELWNPAQGEASARAAEFVRQRNAANAAPPIAAPEVQSGSYTQALYTGDFPTITNDDELDRVVELYRRDAGSRLPPGAPPPPAALTPTPPPTADPEIYPTPIPEEEGGDYGGGGDINFGGRGPRVKPAAEPAPAPVPAEAETPTSRPSGGGKWKGEPIFIGSDEPPKPEPPSILGEGWRGLQRGAVGTLHSVEGIANTVEQKLADWTGSEWLKSTAKSDKEALAKRMDEAAKDYAPTVPNVMAAFDDPSSAPRYVVGKLGEMIPILAGYAVAGMPRMIVFGAIEGANKAYEENNGDVAATLAGAAVGAASFGAPAPFLKGAAGKSFLNNVTRATLGMPIVSTVSEALKPIPKAVAARDVGAYELPTKAEFAEAAASGAIMGPVLGAHGYRNQAGIRAKAAADKAAADKAAAEGTPPPPAAEPPPPTVAEPPPVVPPVAAPPGRSRIQDTYGNEPPPEREVPVYAPPRSKIQERYGTEPPPEGAAPTGEGPKGSPETAPPSVSGDPAATAAIDAAVNPPRSRIQEKFGTEQPTETPTETIVPPVAETPPARQEFRPPPSEIQTQTETLRRTAEAVAEQGRQGVARAEEQYQYQTPAEERGITLNPEQQRTGAVRPETTTDIRTPAAADALKAAEAAGYKLEPDHLDPNRQVAKNPAGEVIGKGGTAQETIADAVQRKGAPYVEETPPVVKNELLNPDYIIAERAKAAEAAKAAPVEEAPAPASSSAEGIPFVMTNAMKRDLRARGHTPEEVRNMTPAEAHEILSKPVEAAAPIEEAPVATPAAPGLRRKAQPAATEEAIAKSKAQTETKPAASAKAWEEFNRLKSSSDFPNLSPLLGSDWASHLPVNKTSERYLSEAQRLMAQKYGAETATEAAKPTTPTTVVRRPTKRVEVTVGKRGEAAVGEESTAQTEAAEAAQQRRLAERRAEKLPPKAQEARRTSLMASEAGRDIKDVQEAPATSKVTRGTPIEEVGEGMQIEHTAESIAETRSKTTTDTSLKYNDLLHDVIQGNKDLDTASKEAGSKAPGTRGRPRKNEDMATYLEREVIPRAERYNRADAAYMRRITPILENRKLTTKQRDKLLERVHESIQKRAKGRGRGEQERENLEDIKRYRDELRGVEKKGGVDAPLYRDPDVEHGIRAAKRLLNLSVNRKLQDRIERSEKTGTMDSVHDYLNEIINNYGAKIAAPDMVEYARHLLRLIPDHVQIGSYKALFERAGLSPEQAAARAAEKQKSAAGTYYPDASGIGLHPRAGGHLENTLHEVTHGVTYDYLDHLFRKQQRGESLTTREQKHVDALDAILKETTRLRDEAAISDREYNELDYAVRAATEGQPAGSDRVVGGRHELVSQIMSNPYVREVLGRTESSPEFKAAMKKLGYGEPANLWQAFKAFVKDIVGFKKGSVLDKVLDPLTDILETSSAHRNAMDMGVELNAPLRGSGEPSGRRWKPGDVPTDGLPSQWVRDKLRPLGEAFVDSPLSDKARARLEGWKPGLARRGTRAIEVASPTHKITEENADVLPAGPQVLRARALIDRATGEYKQKWGNRVQNWVRELRAGPEVGKLMNDATLAETYLTNQPTLFAQRNAHLTGDKLTRAEELQERFNNLTPEKQKLYSDVRDYYRQTYYEQRKLEYEDVVKRFLPEATGDQLTALADKLSTRRGIKEVLADPDVLSQAFGERWENSRALVKEIAKLQDTGWREGDFFPLRRYGDYVLRYGEQGTDNYGVEMFERSSEAAERRAELQKTLPAGTHITDVMSKRADFSRKEFMPESALEDMARAMVKRGASEKEIEQAKDAYAYAMMRRQVSSSQAQSRMYRSGVAGASENVSQNLINHFNSTSSLFGRLTHGAAETEAMRQARQQADAIERASGTPGTAADTARSRSQLDALETRFANKDPAVSQEDIDHARQQHEWLVKPPTSQQTIRARETLNELEKRRAPVDGDDSTTPLGKAAGKFTAASMVYHLIRPAHLAINVADTHANAQSLLGADYGHGRAAAAIVKAMKDLGPSGIGRGFKNALKAVTGNMQASDWHVGDMLTQKLIDLKPGDKAHAQEMRDLSEMAKDYSLVDHTRSREVQRLSRKGGFDFGDPTGGKYPWSNIPSNMMNLFAVGEHTVDSTMRMGVLKAAYDLARARGADPAAAREEARVHAMDVMPVYGGWNTPRIASPRTPYLKDIAPATMQYKLYGFHMYAVMGGLVRKAMFRPEERAEAIKALTGLVATHSILGGVTANLFALPVVAALGAWDWINGEEKPHNYETDLKRTIAEWTGSETASKFASAGLFGLAGANQARSLKLTNMVDVPEVRSFDKAGAGQFIMQGMTGASGDVAGQLFEGLHDLANGDYMKAGKKLLPRVLGDPLKAYDLGQEGVVDKRGRTITPASQVTLGQQLTQAAGFNPYQPSLARERRHEEESVKDEYQFRRRQAIDRYVLSGGKDMSSVRRYMSDEKNRQISPIKFSQLREAMKEERQRERRPEFYGARPTKREERPFREATRFY